MVLDRIGHIHVYYKSRSHWNPMWIGFPPPTESTYIDCYYHYFSCQRHNGQHHNSTHIFLIGYSQCAICNEFYFDIFAIAQLSPKCDLEPVISRPENHYKIYIQRRVCNAIHCLRFLSSWYESKFARVPWILSLFSANRVLFCFYPL